jgi:ABC-type phosphate transport system permease subunit
VALLLNFLCSTSFCVSITRAVRRSMHSHSHSRAHSHPHSWVSPSITNSRLVLVLLIYVISFPVGLLTSTYAYTRVIRVHMIKYCIFFVDVYNLQLTLTLLSFVLYSYNKWLPPSCAHPLFSTICLVKIKVRRSLRCSSPGV